MRSRLFATLALLFGATAAPAQIKSPADLLPADTLAYGELRQPGQLAREVASLFEGSALGNVPDSLARLTAGMKDQPMAAAQARRMFGELGGMGLLFAPEVIREVQRLQGAAVAFTGFKNGQPEWLAVVLPGGSNAPSFAMRAFLATGNAVPAGEVEGVRLYRGRMGWGGGSRLKQPGFGPPGVKSQPGFDPPPPPAKRPPRADKPPVPEKGLVAFQVQDPFGPGAAPGGVAERDLGPVLALTPRALFIGTSDAVKDAIRRVKGKNKTPTLATVKEYLEASKEAGDQPGLFFFFEPPKVMAALAKAFKEGGKDGFRIGKGELAALTAMADLINFKAFRAAAYSLSLKKSTVRYRELVLLDPDQKSPVLDLMPSKPVPTELLHFTPKDAVLVAAMSNGGGKERWATFLKLADAFFKALADAGAPVPVPSDEIAKKEKEWGIEVGKDVFDRISGVSFALGNPLKAPMKRDERQGKGFHQVSVYPEVAAVFAVQATSADAARKLTEELLPKVFSLAHGGKKAEPTSKEIGGQKVYSLAGHPPDALCYGRQGSTLVFGPYAAGVAQALTNGSKKDGWLANAKVAAAVEKAEEPIFLAVARPFTLGVGGIIMSRGKATASGAVQPRVTPGRSVPDKPAPPKDTRPAPDKPLPPARPGKAAAAPPDKLTAPDPREDPGLKELARLLNKEGLLVVRVTRKPDHILEEITLGGLKPMVANLTDFALKQFLPPPRFSGSRGGRPPETSPKPIDRPKDR